MFCRGKLEVDGCLAPIGESRKWGFLKIKRTQGHLGVTLVELLVALALLGLVLVLLFRVFTPGLTIWKTARAEAELEQQAMVAEARIARSLLASDSESFTVLQDPDLHAFSLLSHEGTDADPGYDDLTGRTIWKSVEIFMLRPSNGELYHLKWFGADPDLGYQLPTDSEAEPFRLDPDDLRTLCQDPNLERRLLGRQVTLLNLIPLEDSVGWKFLLESQTSVPKGMKSLQRGAVLVPRIRTHK